MSRLCRFFAILILACAVAACSEPEDEVDVDFMWAVPNPEYKKGETFSPIRDLHVWTSYQGVLKEISPKLVTISVVEPLTPASTSYNEEPQPVKYDEEYKLDAVGTNLIIVEYFHLSAISPIKVLPAGGGTEIIVKWEK